MEYGERNWEKGLMADSFRGIDTYGFPGLATMNWLRANTSACWAGLYLSHAPGMPDQSWIDGYRLIEGTWGIAPLYLGRQRSINGPDQRTAANAVKDGNEAASLAKEAGVGRGKVVYLDIEDGGIQPASSVAYFNSWVDQIRTGGYAAGVYCSYQALDQLVSERPGVVPWVYKLTMKSGQVVGPHFESDLGAPGVPFGTARMQQYVQNCRVNTGVGKGSLLVDVSVSTVADPSVP
jgi:hypothetical protein